jgi:hypothetical protein
MLTLQTCTLIPSFDKTPDSQGGACLESPRYLCAAAGSPVGTELAVKEIGPAPGGGYALARLMYTLYDGSADRPSTSPLCLRFCGVIFEILGNDVVKRS